jgi:hypothetical protein
MLRNKCYVATMSAPKKMSGLAQDAFEVYRDIGPSRTLAQAAKLLERKSDAQLRTWSAKFGWVGLCAEHDHKELKKSLSLREVVRQQAQQQLVDGMSLAAGVLMEIMLDRSMLPVLDRQGEHMRGPAGPNGEPGELLFKPVVKPSTRANCAEKVLGLAGLVPVKRVEVADTTGEELDAAAAALENMHPDDLDEFAAIVKRRNAKLDSESDG